MTTATILLVAVFAFIAWRSPRHGVFIVLATLPSYLIRFNIGPIPTTMLEAMIWILFIATLLRGGPSLLKRGRWRELFKASGNSPNPSLQEGNPLRSLLTPVALLFLAATISIFTSPDLRAALGVWKAYFVDPLLFAVVLFTLRTHSHDVEHGSVRLIIDGLAVCAFFVSLSVIIQWLTRIGIPPPWDLEHRATGLFPYPNANGLLLAPIAVLVIARSVTTKQSSRRWLYAVVGLLSLLAMILTKTEAGLLAAAVGIAAVIFFPLPRRGKVGMGVLIVAIVIGFLLAAPDSKPITDKLFLRDWSGIVRRHTWSETINMLRDRPLLGAGLVGYPTVFVPYHTTRGAIEIFQYPHNMFLNFWSETGLLGLIAFIWILLGVASVSLRSWYKERGFTSATPAAIALLTLLIHGLVDVPYFKNDLAILFWVLIVIPVLQRWNTGRVTQLSK